MVNLPEIENIQIYNYDSMMTAHSHIMADYEFESSSKFIKRGGQNT